MQKAHQSEKEHPSSIAPPRPTVASLTVVQLRTMTTDELVKLLTSPELAQPANAPVRQQVIGVLQEREGNEFVNRLLGLPAGKEAG